MGGLHRFTTWRRAMLTDSGGFQVFSLAGLRRIGEDGVEFQSHVDGTFRTLTPERAMDIQWALGADIAMAFDHVVPGQASHDVACDGMERTLRWLDRCKARHDELADGGPSGLQSLWPIVQGGTHDELRRRSLDGTLERGPWSGIAIGGLSVGEPKPVMHRVLESLGAALPRDTPRYLMGVGFPADLLEGIARGVDLFDCVAATRNGRHGTAWLPSGRVNVRGAGLKGSTRAARPRVRLRDLHHLSARLPATSLRGRGHAGAQAGFAAQHPLPGPAGRAGARPHPGRDVRRLEPGVASPTLRPGDVRRKHVSGARPVRAAASPSSCCRWPRSASCSTS